MKRRLHSYDVREISLVRHPDIRRKLTVIKAAPAEAIDKDWSEEAHPRDNAGRFGEGGGGASGMKDRAASLASHKARAAGRLGKEHREYNAHKAMASKYGKEASRHADGPKSKESSALASHYKSLSDHHGKMADALAVGLRAAGSIAKAAPRIPALDNAPNQDPSVAQAELDQRAQDAMRAAFRLLAPYRDQINAQHLMAGAQAIGMQDGVAPNAMAGAPADVDAGENFDAVSGLDADIDAADGDGEPDLTSGDEDNEPGEDEDIGDAIEDSDEDEPADDEDEDEADDDAPNPLASHLKGAMQKPTNVSDKDHSAALAHAKGKYLDKLKGQGYNLQPKGPAKPTPKVIGKSTMPTDAINKAQPGIDWTSFDAGQREQLEPIFKSFSEVAGENKTLIEKAAALEAKVHAMEDAAETTVLKSRLEEMSHLGDQDKLLKIAKSLTGEAREDYFASLRAQDAQFEEIKKSHGGLFGEIGSRTGGESPMNGPGGTAVAQLEELAAKYVAKSAGPMTHAKAFDAVLQTPEGKTLYAQSERERMGR